MVHRYPFSQLPSSVNFDDLLLETITARLLRLLGHGNSTKTGIVTLLLDQKFLVNILETLDLPPLFISWITICFSSPHYSVSLNGELVGFFPGKKGLRQGDPISSSLFVLAMDVLSKLLDLGVAQNRFSPLPLAVDPLVTHLSFADDLLVFFDGKEESLDGILNILKEFEIASGLALSLRKACLFLDGDNGQASEVLARRFGLINGAFPVRYLGVPLMPHKLRPQDYQPLIDKVKSRIGSWTVRRLCFAGRLQLIHSVLYGTVSFWSSIFPLPKTCLETIEKILNAFLWSGAPNSAKGAKVSWETVCLPKSAGGLGLRRLADLNQVFGLKLIWELVVEKVDETKESCKTISPLKSRVRENCLFLARQLDFPRTSYRDYGCKWSESFWYLSKCNSESSCEEWILVVAPR
ncbi:unnamed protein product [Microthlaspi erraticum]|uniref:Reverse transcriptase domain-containing protein n=1 Tax=Microthlaspi erraticum TaxID=1685480 RepID=A0A6D2KET1_9BRAS|nr:unnamed protein product [Microthlaspi erraticum]CAA7050355.1 unnamed protein product [Microthlaspi erraticum]